MNAQSWMDAAFALDDPDFVDLKAAVDEMQWRKVLASGGSDVATLSAFLDEMEQLDMESLMPFKNAASDTSTWQSSHQQSDDAAAVTVASVAVPPVRKKKLSSTERRKRDKAELLKRLVQLQMQLQGLQTQQQQTNSQHDVERQREELDTQRMLDTNLRVRQALTLEQSRSDEVTMLLNQLSAPMKALTYSDGNPVIENDAAHDAATFEILRRNINENYTLLAHEWGSGSIPFATSEALDVSVNLEGNVITFTSARVFPFNISTISDTLWRVAHTGFQSNSFKTISELDVDLIAIKEQLTIHPAGHNDVTLCVRTAMKRIVRENYVVFMWETVCVWSTPSSTQASTTKESGWALIRPTNTTAGSPMSVMQSLMKMTLVDSSMPWTRLMHESGVMLPIIIPSSQQVMLDRIQHLENCLIDDAMQMNLSPRR